MIQPSPQAGMKECFVGVLTVLVADRTERGDSPGTVQSFGLPATMRQEFNEHTPESVETSKAPLSIFCIKARSATPHTTSER